MESTGKSGNGKSPDSEEMKQQLTKIPDVEQVKDAIKIASEEVNQIKDTISNDVDQGKEALKKASEEVNRLKDSFKLEVENAKDTIRTVTAEVEQVKLTVTKNVEEVRDTITKELIKDSEQINDALKHVHEIAEEALKNISDADQLKDTLDKEVFTEENKEKIARGLINRIGRALLMSCMKKRGKKKKGEDGEEGEDDEEEFALADALLKPDERTKSMLSKLEGQIKAKIVDELNSPNPSKFIFIGYKTQQISGTDYFLKIKAKNSGQYFHARIYESLEKEVRLVDVVGPKLNSDNIEIPNEVQYLN